ncbi:MAG: orotidine-5'-phosphate decarboxylase [Myxococcota bacterium]
MHFADTLVTRMRELGHPLCAGLDPHRDLLPPLFRRGSMEVRDPETAAVVEEFLLAVLDRLDGRVAAVKPQIAFFEELGARGLSALERVVAAARERDLAVVLDAKRSDIGSTAEGYARAYLEPGAACEVDALTLNPYLGLDSLRPFADRAVPHGRGLFVLVHTSNPGAADYQERTLDKGGPLYAAVAESLVPLCEELVGPATQWSSLGIVAGATYPESAEKLREQLPRALFLVPGYGAQGGTAAEAVRAFVSGPAGREGGLVNSSRALTFPEAARSADNAADWERAIDASIDRAAGELAEAVAR